MRSKLKDQRSVVYESLTNDYSHFEIAFLSVQKAVEIIRSAAYLNIPQSTEPTKKPKVSVVALKILCDDVEYAKAYKSEIMKNMFEEEEEEDSYNAENLEGNEN